jgi:hypothetical protein
MLRRAGPARGTEPERPDACSWSIISAIEEADMVWKAGLAAALLVALAACGTSKTDRGLSGGAIGAGLGAAGSAVTGGSALGGAALGGAVGAATGVLTDDKDVDLGKPVWKR